MKNLLLIIVTLFFSLTSFSQEKNSSGVILENNTLKYVGDLEGEIYRFDMSVSFNEKNVRLKKVDGNKLTDEMVEIFNELPKHFNVGDTTLVVFQNISLLPKKYLNTDYSCEDGDLIKISPYLHRIIF
jgi:hypothetical protein